MKRISILVLAFLLAGGGAAAVKKSAASDWRTASREPTGIAPDPATNSEAIVQVYVARAFSWRGYFGVHSWIAAKPTGAPAFTVYEVIGWRARRGMPTVAVSHRPPDGRWFGNPPEIIADLRGPEVDEVIGRIEQAARDYPLTDEYRVWPGPNSNTFIAYVGRAVPELKLDLPPTAIGKDYLTNDSVFDETPSGTGYQFSLFGLLGVLVGSEEGIEINLLGLTFGVDPLDLAVKLPIVGRLGPEAEAETEVEAEVEAAAEAEAKSDQ